MENYKIACPIADEYILTHALENKKIEFFLKSIIYKNEYGIEIELQDIDESGEDLSKTVDSIVIDINIDCSSEKLEEIFSEIEEEDGYLLELE